MGGAYQSLTFSNSAQLKPTASASFDQKQLKTCADVNDAQSQSTMAPHTQHQQIATHLPLPDLSPLGGTGAFFMSTQIMQMLIGEFGCKDFGIPRTLTATTPSTFTRTHTGTRATRRRRSTKPRPDSHQKWLKRSGLCSTWCGYEKWSKVCELKVKVLCEESRNDMEC